MENEKIVKIPTFWVLKWFLPNIFVTNEKYPLWVLKWPSCPFSFSFSLVSHVVFIRLSPLYFFSSMQDKTLTFFIFFPSTLPPFSVRMTHEVRLFFFPSRLLYMTCRIVWYTNVKNRWKYVMIKPGGLSYPRDWKAQDPLGDTMQPNCSLALGWCDKRWVIYLEVGYVQCKVVIKEVSLLSDKYLTFPLSLHSNLGK